MTPEQELCQEIVNLSRRIQSRISKTNGGILGRSGMFDDILSMQEHLNTLRAMVRTLPEGS